MSAGPDTRCDRRYQFALLVLAPLFMLAPGYRRWRLPPPLVFREVL
jgi:hypothetical protein